MLRNIENGPREIERERERKKGENETFCQSGHQPHVDEILSESDGLAVSADGDRPVEVGRRVPVLAVRDPYHRPADLPEHSGLHYCSVFVPAVAGHECHKSF